MDISRLTPAELDRFIHIQSIVGRQEEASARVRDYRAYYDGDHPTLLTQRQQEFLGPLLTESEFPFSYNLTRSVLDTLEERLEVVGFTVNGKGAEDIGEDEAVADPEASLAALFWEWWTANRMDAQQSRLYRRTLRDITSFVSVDFDEENQRPRLNLHSVDDGSVGVTCHRDASDPNRIIFTNRYFYTGVNPLEPGEAGTQRKTTYMPGQIRKYQIDGKMAGSWQPVMDEEDNGVWPIPWVDKAGKPLGVAMIEFQNPGGSEIQSIIPLQNALNKSELDLIAAADAQGFPVMAIEYADSTGGIIEDDDDLEGADEFRIAPGRAIELFGAHLNRIPGADLSGLLDTIKHFMDAIGSVSRTPSYYLHPVGGDVPSGEALKQLESGLVKRAEKRQLVFGQSWQDVFKLAARVANTFGNVDIPDKMTIGVIWADPNVRNEKTTAETAKMHKELGVPDDVTQSMLGYTPDQIAQFKDDARLQKAQDVASIASAVRADQVRNAPQTNPTRGNA